MHKILAYYRTEDDAESAKAKLETLEVHNLTVEKIPDDSNEFVDVIRDIFTDDDRYEDEHAPQVLRFEVTNDDVAEANRIVKESEGYISRE